MSNDSTTGQHVLHSIAHRKHVQIIFLEQQSNLNVYTFAADAPLPMVDPAQIGLPGCNTTCGNLIVPYPFGISPGCYWPGFELFCDTSDDFPRLVIIDSGSILEVVDISLPDSTIRVSHRTSIIYNATNFSDKMLSDDKFQILDIMSETYTLSTRNELILFGCDVQATLHGEYTNGGGGNTSSSDNIISQCVSICTSGRDHGAGTPVVQGGNCSGHDGCCHAPISVGRRPNEVYMKILNLSIGQQTSPFALISEDGMTDQWYSIVSKWMTNQWTPDYITYPLVLMWAIKQGFSVPADNSGHCPKDVASRLCKSHHSECQQENGGFTCYCSTNYHGNPYIPDGCRGLYSLLMILTPKTSLLII